MDKGNKIMDEMIYEGKYLSIRNDLAWQFTTKKRQLTFWGRVRNSIDYIQWGWSGGFKILGFMLSWRVYGKKCNRIKSWYPNRWRHRREREASAVSYEQEGFPDIAARIRAQI